MAEASAAYCPDCGTRQQPSDTLADAIHKAQVHNDCCQDKRRHDQQFR